MWLDDVIIILDQVFNLVCQGNKSMIPPKWNMSFFFAFFRKLFMPVIFIT